MSAFRSRCINRFLGWWWVKIETFGHQIKQINYRCESERVSRKKKEIPNDALWRDEVWSGNDGHNFPPLNRFHIDRWKCRMTTIAAANEPSTEKTNAHTLGRYTTEWALRYLYLIINNFILILFYYYCHNYAFRFFLSDVAGLHTHTFFRSILLFCFLFFFCRV